MSASRHELVADLLMGAAHADKHLERRELEAVKKLLRQAMRVKKLPKRMLARIDAFDPALFSVAETVWQMNLPTGRDKRHILELVAAVHESDDLWDLDEDAYLREVAEAMGLAPKDYEDLAIDALSIEEIGEELLADKPKPPPLPTS